MNFSISREVLLENLNLVSKALPVKSAIPSLFGVKVELTDNELFLTASNSDIAISVIVNHSTLEILDVGKVLIPGKYLVDIIRKIDASKINIGLIENKLLVIKTDRSEFKLNLLELPDYPEIEFLSLDTPLVIDSIALKDIIKATAYATAKNEKRPMLTGVHFEYDSENLKCLATDSFRLSVKKIELPQKYDAFISVIPGNSLDELKKILDIIDGTVSMYLSKNKVLFRIKNVLFQSRVLEGSYPDTSRLVQNEYPVNVSFHKEELINTIERISLLSAKEYEHNLSVIKLQIHADHVIEISSANAGIGFAREEIFPCEPLVGSELKIAFSAKYLLEALRAMNSSVIKLYFTNEIKPFILKGDLDSELINLILPIRVEW